DRHQGEIAIVVLGSGREIAVYRGRFGQPLRLVFSPGGEWLAAESEWPVLGKLILWNARPSDSGSLPARFQGGAPPPHVQFSLDSKRLDIRGQVWDAETGKHLPHVLRDAGFGAKEERRLSARLTTESAGVEVSDAQTGKVLHSFRFGGRADDIGVCCLSPD